MKNKMKFKVNEELDKVFREKTKDLNSGQFIFNYNSFKVSLNKAFKIISNAIEDDWAVSKVYHSVDKDVCQVIIDANKRQRQKFVFPKDDHHFDRKKDRYQYHTYLAALQFVKNHRTALDIGGHIGFYSSAMSDSFEEVIAFEPSPINFKCFVENVPDVKVYHVGLGDTSKTIELNIALDNSGNSSIVESFGGVKVPIKIRTLDSFNLNNIDLIKIDVQGYELQVLKGGEETIKRNHPIIIAELITHKDSPPNQEALSLIESYGYKILMKMGKDYILG